MTDKDSCGSCEAFPERPGASFTAHFGSFAILISVCAALGLGTPEMAASPPGDVVGKVSVGYQGWFACTSDGSPINAWWHWAPNSSQTPSSNNIGIYCWPDMRQYERGFQTAFTNLGNGQPTTLFTSYDQQVVDTHFRWMEENEIDTAALQRFSPFGGEGPTRNGMTLKVRSAAEAYNRKFYIMYDVSGWANMKSELKTDWTTKMSAYTVSSAYARQKRQAGDGSQSAGGRSRQGECGLSRLVCMQCGWIPHQCLVALDPQLTNAGIE